MGRKKRIGFADLQATQAEFERGELRCPECKRKLSEEDAPKLVSTLGSSAPTLATLSCPRCRTMLSIRFVTAPRGDAADNG